MIAFSIWSINIYWYWIFYVVWFLLGYAFLKLIARSQIFKNHKSFQNLLVNHLEDILIYIILWVLLWWRLGEVFIYQWDYFSKNLLDIFAVWNGGMSFIGGIVWVCISLMIFAKKYKLSVPYFFVLLDIILVVVPLAIVFGRLWNFLNQELYGLIIPSDYWWISSNLVIFLKQINIFYIYDSIDQNLRINTNFISILFEWIVVFAIVLKVFLRQLKKASLKPALISGYFILFYSLFRFFIEYFRVDSQSQYLFWFTRSQWIFILFFVFGIYLIFDKRLKAIKIKT